jgi:hypothetical protein
MYKNKYTKSLLKNRERERERERERCQTRKVLTIFIPKKYRKTNNYFTISRLKPSVHLKSRHTNKIQYKKNHNKKNRQISGDQREKISHIYLYKAMAQTC